MYKDSDGAKLKAGDTVIFSYGIPPLRVEAPLVEKNGKLVAITKGHTPSECEVKELIGYVGNIYKKESKQ